MYINENFKQKYLKYKKKYYKLKKGGEWNTKEREEWNRLYPCTPSQTDLKSKLDELKKDKEYEEQYRREEEARRQKSLLNRAKKALVGPKRDKVVAS